MQVRALRKTDIGRVRHKPGAEFEIEDRYGDLLIRAGQVEQVGGEAPRRRGRPKGSKNKQMAAGENYQRTDIQTDDQETK